MSDEKLTVKTVRVGAWSASVYPIMIKGEPYWSPKYYNKAGELIFVGRYKKLKKAKDKAFEALSLLDKATSARNAVSSEEIEMLKLIREADLDLDDMRKISKEKKSINELSLSEVIELFLSTQVIGQGYSITQRNDYLTTLGSLCEHFPNTKMWLITLSDIEQYTLTWRTKSGSLVGASRFNNRRSILNKLWSWAVPRDYASKNIITGVVRKKGSVKDRHDVLTPNEFALMLANCDETFLPWLALSGFGGFRGVEIYGRPKERDSGLRWEDFHWDKKIITLRGSSSKKTENKNGRKVGKPRIVPMSDALIDWLEPWRNAKGLVHPHKRMPTGGTNSTSDKLGSLIGGWRSNALRASRASYRMAQIKSLTQLTLEMGHTKDVFLKEYHNPRVEEDAELWFSLNRKKAKIIVDEKIIKLA